MPRRYPSLLFTESVRRAQERHGSRALAARLEADERDDSALGWREREFIQDRDSFYLASVGEGGWPYVQFRGGPPGFLRVIDGRTLAYADFRGNRQYISVGNIAADDRVSLFLMDHANRRRLKILARARIHESGAESDLARRVALPGYDATVERVVVFHVEAFDWNCSQHITPRYTEEEFARRGPEGRGS